MTRKMASAFVFTIMIGIAQAEEPVHGLGFAAGQPSGLGLSYRRMTDNYGFQVF